MGKETKKFVVELPEDVASAKSLSEHVVYMPLEEFDMRWGVVGSFDEELPPPAVIQAEAKKRKITMISSNETFTLDEMQELYGEIREKAYNSYVVIDGENYSTDWGYGLDGIMYFLEMLKRRHEKEETMSA